MKKILFIIAVLLIIDGCGSDIGEDVTKMKGETVLEFQKMMDEDITGNQMAVNWNGEQTTLIKDTMDDIEILDGRNGNYAYITVEKDTWFTKLPDTKQYQIHVDQEKCFIVEGDCWELEITAVDLEETAHELSDDPWLQAVTKQDLNQTVMERFEQAALYRGLKQCEKGIRAGYVFALQDYFGNSWKLSYVGTGNMNQIKADAMMIFENFRTIIV